MGWSFRKGATKDQIIADILKPWDSTVTAEDIRTGWSRKPLGTRTTSIVLEHRCVGNSLWVVRETTVAIPGEEPQSRKWIGLSLLDSHPGYGWGHKDMDESMGIYDWSCPVEFLDLAPLPESPYAAEWRDKVRAGQPQMPLFEAVR